MNYFKSHRFGPVKAYEMGFAPIGPPYMTVFMYMMDGVVVDTGQRHMRKHVTELISESKVTHILLTHHHEDHSGNAGEIGKMKKIDVLGHTLAKEKMRNSFNILPYQHYMSGKAGKAKITPYPSVIETGHLRLRPVHTPGHSRDHTVYLEEKNGWLFSGDLYLGDKINFFRVDERIDDQIASLKKILKFDFEALFCGHRPHLKNGRLRLKRKLNFLRTFHESVSMLVNEGVPEKAIVKKMKIKSDWKVMLFTLGNVSFANMVRSSIRETLSNRDP